MQQHLANLAQRRFMAIIALVLVTIGAGAGWAPDSPPSQGGREADASARAGAPGGNNTTWQIWPSAAAAADEENAGSHSWIAVPTLDAQDGRDPWRLMHLPPRRTLGADGRAHGSGDGELRASIVLSSRPRAIAAVGSAVYVLFPTVKRASPISRGQADRAGREVVSVRAVQAGIADLWVDEPLDVVTPEPTLEGSGTFLGFVGTPLGPAALLSEDGKPVLRILNRGEWRTVAIPTAAALELDGASAESIRLVQTSGGFRAIQFGTDGHVAIWNVDLTAASVESVGVGAGPGAEEPARRESGARREPGAWRTGRQAWVRRGQFATAMRVQISSEWTRTAAKVPLELADAKLTATMRVISSAGRLVTLHREASGDVLVGVLESPAWRPLARVKEVPADFSAVAIDGLGRMALAWSAEDAAPQETGSALLSRRASLRTHLEVCELSAWTGRMLYEGPAARQGLVGATEFRLLAVGMLGLMAIVLTLIVRKDEDGQVFALPEGVALCEPGRRVAAGLIDLVLVFVLASRVMGISPIQFFEPSVLLSGMSVSIILLTSLLGAVLGTLTEALFARSPGKLLMGCEVLAVVKAGGVPPRAWGSLWRAAVRNAVKWGLPPLGVFGVLDLSGRHRGDQMAGTVVIVRFEPDDEEEAQE